MLDLMVPKSDGGDITFSDTRVGRHLWEKAADTSWTGNILCEALENMLEKWKSLMELVHLLLVRIWKSSWGPQ